jgi:chromosome segregation ATPase
LLAEADREMSEWKQASESRGGDLEAAHSRVAELEGRLQETDATAQAVQTDLEASRRRIAELEGGLHEGESRAHAAQSDLEAAQSDLEAARGRVAELEGGLQEAESRAQAAQSDLDASRGRIAELERQLESDAARLRAAEGDAGAGSQRVGELEELLSEADREIAQSKEALAASGRDLDAMRARVEDLERARQSAEAKAEEYRVEVENAQAESQRVRAETQEAHGRAQALQAEAEAARDRVAELEAQGAELTERLHGVESDASAGAARLEERAGAAERDREEMAARLAEQETQMQNLIARWDTAESQGEALASSQQEIGARVAGLSEEIEATRLLSDELRAGLTEDQRRVGDLESRLGAAEGLGEDLGGARARVEELESELSGLRERLAEADGLRDLESQLREQLADLEAQRSALAEEVETERGLRERARRDADELRESIAAAGDGALEQQLKSLQERYDEAVARHAQETRQLREEAELQKDLARQRESEMGKLSEECSILQQSVEDALTELDGVRAQRTSLGEELRALEEISAAAELQANGDAHGLTLEQEASPDEEEGGEEISEEEIESALAEIEGSANHELEEGVDQREQIVLCVDGDPVLQSAVESAIARTQRARCITDLDEEIPENSDVHLVVNLASEQFTLDLIAGSARFGLDEPEALVYCGKDGRGVCFRKVTFFPPPYDVDECSARLLSGSDSLQRLLAVGEDVDFMSGLRESLGKVRTSTAIAFDGRQAVDLIPMVKPQMILVDLNLPRGDGLRVASQVAADPAQRNVKIAMFWSKPIDPLVFRQQAIYALRDFHLEPEQLGRLLYQALNEDLPHAGSASAFRGSSGSQQAASQHGR